LKSDTAEDDDNGDVESTGSSVDVLFANLQGGNYYGDSEED
jgi:hypothetical protein